MQRLPVFTSLRDIGQVRDLLAASGAGQLLEAARPDPTDPTDPTDPGPDPATG